ncbi:MAG: hypothetical protein K2W92_07130 [Alphaproteobacteria bacterium]|nr:hypothetical protein [Alphaproteobacteria bacterium]
MTKTYMLASIKVGDFAKWKSVYDEDVKLRDDAGLKERYIFTCMKDPKNITLLFAIDSVEKAKAFLESPEIREHMERATVMGDPEICFFHKVHETCCHEPC